MAAAPSGKAADFPSYCMPTTCVNCVFLFFFSFLSVIIIIIKPSCRLLLQIYQYFCAGGGSFFCVVLLYLGVSAFTHYAASIASSTFSTSLSVL